MTELPVDVDIGSVTATTAYVVTGPALTQAGQQFVEVVGAIAAPRRWRCGARPRPAGRPIGRSRRTLGAVSDPGVTTHRIRSARIGTVLALVGVFLATFSLLFDPVYTVHQTSPVSDDAWVVVPAVLLLLALAWRAMRARIELSQTGMRIVRATTSDEVEWADLRRFEVRPTPNRWGWRVLARRGDDDLVAVATVPGRAHKARHEAETLAAALEADRHRLATDVHAHA